MAWRRGKRSIGHRRLDLLLYYYWRSVYRDVMTIMSLKHRLPISDPNLKFNDNSCHVHPVILHACAHVYRYYSFNSIPTAEPTFSRSGLCKKFRFEHWKKISTTHHRKIAPTIYYACFGIILLQSISFCFDLSFFKIILRYEKYDTRLCIIYHRWVLNVIAYIIIYSVSFV